MQNFASSYNFLPIFGIGAGLFTIGAILFFVLMIAIMALKGYSLWISARRDDKGWFVALLLLNTFGILELVYLYFVADIWNKKPKVNNEANKSADTTTSNSTTAK